MISHRLATKLGLTTQVVHVDVLLWSILPTLVGWSHFFKLNYVLVYRWYWELILNLMYTAEWNASLDQWGYGLNHSFAAFLSYSFFIFNWFISSPTRCFVNFHLIIATCLHSQDLRHYWQPDYILKALGSHPTHYITS